MVWKVNLESWSVINIEQNIKNDKYYIISNDNHFSYANKHKNILFENIIFQGKSPILNVISMK